MNCEEFKYQIDLDLRAGHLELSSEMEFHIAGCGSCRSYYLQLDALRNLLGREKFEVVPGELDELTFENIAGTERPSPYKLSFREAIFSGMRKWIWVPAAAAVIVIMAAVYFHFGGVPDYYGQAVVETEYPVSGDTSSAIENIGDWSYVIKSLISDESEFDVAEEELSTDIDFDDALINLSDEQLNSLYNLIQTMNGSTL